ncbi:ABC transporter ATP-binding protein [Bradyrhizobium sp. NP1]|uniref:ABC transporter ATP-binding protein n=1 Tax=Bradyrhizobium sp. NP1 TaxID=3049772 RepID=UPI0025A6078D|nr:ABC transporter ATP-binding protein [Bradyrhizobium sp. NP1]WJR76807.1 ABC transporter ATP-binding protein [Bradyrhizobium sp. NP1]
MTRAQPTEPMTASEAKVAWALRVEDMTVTLKTRTGTDLQVVEGVSLAVRPGEVMGLVGESGCGKSVTAQAIMGVLQGSMKIASGRIWLGEQELTALPDRKRREIRGRDIAMVFQDPMSSLNPLMTIGSQIAESLIIHQLASRKEARSRALELLRLVRISSPEIRMSEYPHRLSGGMRQRVMIAIALACKPKVIIADEPTTALDVTIQRDILNLLRDLQQELGLSVLMITHDFGVVKEFADNVTVMYAGKVVERAACADLFDHPIHPYTTRLLAATPRFDRSVDGDVRKRMVEIPGIVPPLGMLPAGCNFHPRCDLKSERCLADKPLLLPVGSTHNVACFNARGAHAVR